MENIIILCPDYNLAGLRATVGSVKRELHNVSYCAVVGENANREDIADLEQFSKVYQGGKTVTSLIDTGAKHSKDWCFFVISGGLVKESIFRKYQYFRRDDKDVLFPVIDRKVWFYEASINGIMVHRKAFDEIGPMGDEEPDLEFAKLSWANKAIDNKYQFKAIVGGRMF